MAAQLGTSYQDKANTEVCARFYPTCPHNAQQMIHMFITEDETNNLPTVQPKTPQTSNNLPKNHPRQPNMTPNQLWKSLLKMSGHQQ